MNTNEVIERWLRIFAREFIQNRSKDIVARDLRNTQALLRSLYAKVHADQANSVFFMTVFFNSYGRYQDMRRQYTKAGGIEMIQQLEAWAEREGIAKFRKGKYADKYRNESDARVKQAIAWGIVKKLPQRAGTRKRSWWNTGKTRDIENYYDTLLRAVRESVTQELKNQT